MHTTYNLCITVDMGYETYIATIYSDEDIQPKITKIGEIVLDRNNAIFPGDAVISVAMRAFWRNDANRPYTPYEEFLTVWDEANIRAVTADIRVYTTEDAHSVVIHYKPAYTHTTRYERTYSRHYAPTAQVLPFFPDWKDAVMHFLFATIYRTEYKAVEFGRLRANYINLA